MGYKIHYGPPFTIKEWNDFMHGLNDLFGGQLDPEYPKSLTEKDLAQDASSDARALFITGIALKQVAANLPEGHALASAADQAIADWEDDYCGTPPRPLPTLGLATSLAAFASTLQAGELQAAIQEEAGRLARRAFAPAPATQPAAAKAA